MSVTDGAGAASIFLCRRRISFCKKRLDFLLPPPPTHFMQMCIFVYAVCFLTPFLRQLLVYQQSQVFAAEALRAETVVVGRGNCTH